MENYQDSQSVYTPPAYQQGPALQYVSVWPRFLAVFIDSIIIIIISGIIELLLFSHNTKAAESATFVIAMLYFIILEGTMGATLGKKILGLKVVNQDGSPISWGASIIRNILRIIDWIFCYILGAILIWTSSTRQRLGDRAAHTVVVKSR
ncbi:MAG TPA: RDD family protein [Dictyobacter sp.]|jgi:uncharacterized RDD family membrane protein YckC|nr:RDD family protein [Dictyobacter sp.]